MIFEIVRSENRHGDERDLKNKEKSYSIGASVETLVFIIMVTVEEGILNRSATDIWVIYTAIEFSIALSGAILSKKMADMLINFYWYYFCVYGILLHKRKSSNNCIKLLYKLKISFKINLKKYRTQAQLSQAQLAEMVGVSRNTISSIETGKFNSTA